MFEILSSLKRTHDDNPNRISKARAVGRAKRDWSRRLFLEPLEDRRLLATTDGGLAEFFPWMPVQTLSYGRGADELALADGANVDAWADESGRGNDLGNRQNSVTFVASSPDFNNLPAVQFGDGTPAGPGGDATRGWLESTALLSNGTHAETFWVLSTPHATNTNNSGQSGGFMRIGSNSNQHWDWSDNNIYENFSRGNRPGWNPGAEPTGPLVYNVAGDDDGRWNALIDGSIVRDEATSSVGTPTYHGDWYYGRGQSSNNGNVDWDGVVPEIIITNRTLTDAERLVVQNYLSSKYNIALTAGDLFAGDTSGNGEHDFDLFGVARDADGDEVLDAGSAGFGIEVSSLATTITFWPLTTAAPARRPPASALRACSSGLTVHGRSISPAHRAGRSHLTTATPVLPAMRWTCSSTCCTASTGRASRRWPPSLIRVPGTTRSRFPV